jgi:hypothetical protein
MIEHGMPHVHARGGSVQNRESMMGMTEPEMVEHGMTTYPIYIYNIYKRNPRSLGFSFDASPGRWIPRGA